MSLTTVILLLSGLALSPGGMPDEASRSATTDEDLVWLRNDVVKVALKRSSGGAISWISPVASDTSLINSYDRGRLVQQSWYGREDGSDWNGKPWRWNPVQGGDWKGNSAVILEERHTADTSFVSTQPVHWASGERLTDCSMQQTVVLQGHLIHVHYEFRYQGREPHPPQHQELPAFFADARCGTLVTCDTGPAWTGAALTRSRPGEQNEYRKIPEHWAAWVDDQDFGIACYVPAADELTCYRVQPDRRSPSACNYFAPIRTIAVTPDFNYEYDVWVTMGTIDEIRERFRRLAETP